MKDQYKTKRQLIEELTELRSRVTELEASEVNRDYLETALERSETKFRSLTERSVVGVYLIQDGFFRYVNPKLAEIFGYEPKEIIDRLPPWSLVFKEDRNQLEENLRKRISGEIESVNYPFRGIKKDGSVIYIEAYGSRMEYEGAPAIIGSLIDITERKIAEEAMNAEKKRFQSLCENVPFGVVMVERDGSFVYKNPQFIELFGHESDCGWDPQQPGFQKTGSLHGGKPPHQWKSYMRGLGRGGARSRTLGVQCANGKEKIVNFRPVKLDKKSYLVTCEDITHRIESEEALRKSERRYKTLVEEINDGYFVIQDKRIAFANQAFCRMHGTTLENVLGRSFMSFVSPECRKDLLEAYWGVLAGRPAEGQIQYSRVGAPADQADTEVKARATDLGEGPVIIGICRDISERVAMESKIREHERMAYVGHLSASLSHEIRNPLSSIKMNLQILARKLDLDGYDRRRLEITVHEVSRLETILRQLLDTARPMTINRARVDISVLARGCVDLLEAKAHEKNVQIVERYPKSVPITEVDPGKLEQALINLLLNAIEATPEGGRITVWSKDKSGKEDGYVELGVRDTGSGIDHDQLVHLFTPFYTSKAQGSGLGLSNVKRIVEAHSGEVRVSSRKGVGATFLLRLPCNL